MLKADTTALYEICPGTERCSGLYRGDMSVVSVGAGNYSPRIVTETLGSAPIITGIIDSTTPSKILSTSPRRPPSCGSGSLLPISVNKCNL